MIKVNGLCISKKTRYADRLLYCDICKTRIDKQKFKQHYQQMHSLQAMINQTQINNNEASLSYGGATQQSVITAMHNNQNNFPQQLNSQLIITHSTNKHNKHSKSFDSGGTLNPLNSSQQNQVYPNRKQSNQLMLSLQEINKKQQQESSKGVSGGFFNLFQNQKSDYSQASTINDQRSKYQNVRLKQPINGFLEMKQNQDQFSKQGFLQNYNYNTYDSRASSRDGSILGFRRNKIVQNQNIIEFKSPQKWDPHFEKRLNERKIFKEQSLYSVNSELAKRYVISKEWYNQWVDFLYGQTDTCPKQIDNQGLVNDINERGFENLIRNIDYFTLPFQTWHSLLTIYGGGPQILQLYQGKVQIEQSRKKESKGLWVIIQFIQVRNFRYKLVFYKIKLYKYQSFQYFYKYRLTFRYIIQMLNSLYKLQMLQLISDMPFLQKHLDIKNKHIKIQQILLIKYINEVLHKLFMNFKLKKL